MKTSNNNDMGAFGLSLTAGMMTAFTLVIAWVLISLIKWDFDVSDIGLRFLVVFSGFVSAVSYVIAKCLSI
jgi:hypothetical protein